MSLIAGRETIVIDTALRDYDDELLANEQLHAMAMRIRVGLRAGADPVTEPPPNPFDDRRLDERWPRSRFTHALARIRAWYQEIVD